MNVSRETSTDSVASVEPEQEPTFAASLFGDGIASARRFAANLIDSGEELGLIGPLELPRLWTRHLVNCVLLAPLLNPGRVADIGSGAGFPGLVLATVRRDVNFVLIEPMERRAMWLRDQVKDLNLPNVEVLRSRAEDATGVGVFDQVTARAVSALSKLIPLAAPLVRPGGEILFLKGAGVPRELDAAAKVVRKSGLSNVAIVTLGEELGERSTWLFRATVD